MENTKIFTGKEDTKRVVDFWINNEKNSVAVTLTKRIDYKASRIKKK